MVFLLGKRGLEDPRWTRAVGVRVARPQGEDESGGRSMRAVKGSLGHSSKERYRELDGPRSTCADRDQTRPQLRGETG